MLNVPSTEFQRRSILGNAKERRPNKAARLLSGNFLHPTHKIPCSRLFYQAGIGTYTSNVLKTPVVESISKLLDEMIAWNLPEHIKGLSTPVRLPQSHHA